LKYLLVLVVILIAVQVWRSNRKPGREDLPPARKPEPPRQLEMVRCAVCGLHLPRTDAVNTSAASYCSNEHRLQAEH
jgi:uncharacterized protein